MSTIQARRPARDYLLRLLDECAELLSQLSKSGMESVDDLSTRVDIALARERRVNQQRPLRSRAKAKG